MSSALLILNDGGLALAESMAVLQGKIDQLHVRKDQRGVVFLMNVGAVEEAKALLEDLPLGRAGMMKFDYIPIGPLWPINFILLPRSA